ncbi:P-loop containing nucleoside triphosphate hydrolase protein [Leucogyrophana mollusca]|uniref:P-loop containing nucleoside triphosphate hydrolase protein n=1 Tax=Leucogyrophana mollusca TaxID=85980 RepID=A0ACB8BTU7_9AGAM|nr:P-loop containing nucleoside triphosphate hydrolase protein [Leucogyrophana mollusca]
MTYASLLGVISVTGRPRWNRIASNHLAALLFVTFAVYAHRDLYPLATFTKQPQDISEGWLLWTKVVILAFIGALFPVISPRHYVPFDPADPADTPHPEQIAPWLSMLTYSWEDPIVYLAYRMPHLSHEKLPPLADQDRSKNLVKKSFPELDPFSGSKRRHIFFGLMKVYRTEYMILALMISFYAVASVGSPIGINYLLLYLETNGEGAVVRPWVWIAWLFLGPTVGSLAIQWYTFLATRVLVRTEGTITQLVFEHALRIRMKAELPDDSRNSGEPATVSSPDTPSITQRRTAAQEGPDGSDDEMTHASSASDSSSPLRMATLKTKDTKSAREDDDNQMPKSSADNLVGKMNNLVTTDLTNIIEGRDFLFLVLYIPLQTALCIWFLYGILGGSALVGLVVMVLLFPLPGYVGKRIQTVQIKKMHKTDARVQTVTETMNVLRMVKLFGWENKMDKKITEKREEELVWTWKQKILELINNNLNLAIPLLTMLATYSTYTLIMGQTLSASKVFSSMSIFDIMKVQLQAVFYLVADLIQAKVSLDRVNSFLVDTELLDSFSKTDERGTPLFSQSEEESTVIGFRNALFAWSNRSNGSLTPSKRQFTLHIDDQVFFHRGRINLIVGPTGSGKTSMLMALLGEMHFIPSGPTSWFNLPRKGGVAYAAQESWVQNETIRENILFGSPYDATRYKKVLYQCALERDLTLFEAGDRTEVGEKGLTLSGGQKARITLARAIYSSAQILLLDDILAALDVHTSKWIVDKCLAGDLVKGRTVILVTHNVAMTSVIAHFVVSLGSNGRIVSQGSISDAIAKDGKLAAEMAKEQEAIEEAIEETIDQEPDTIDAEQEVEAETAVDGKLVVAEEILEGHISWPAFKLYLASLGGQYPLLFWVVFVGLMVITDLVDSVQTWFLGYWASQYEDHAPSEVKVESYLVVYALLLVLASIGYLSGWAIYYYGSMRASKTIHKKLIVSVLGTTLRWLDTTPTSRVITRCTQDIRAIDGPFAQGIGMAVEGSLKMLVKLGAVVLMTPVFLVPGVVVGVIGGIVGRIYMKAQLSVKREMSIAKAPVLGHFGAAIAGLTSIRAYGAQESFKQKSLVRIDRYTKSARMFYNLNRWVCVRIDSMGALFSAGLAAYLVYGPSGSQPSNIGFSLNMAVGFSSMILWWVRILNEVEVNGNSLERIDSYIQIEQEPKPTEGGQPPAYWPASGDLRVEKLSARYSSDGPKVLKDLSFHIASGERVGIVGRTGSGKSSLTLSLLRSIFTDGEVYYDGIPTRSLNLEALRSNVTIIPQIPELLTGTLRQNLDPFDQHDDAVLNDALRSAGLFAVQDESDEGRLTLDSPISSGGGNLSVGQRQILALARAMVRGSKLLILDEATSAIDYKTDSAIQSSLRNSLHDVTQIIVAHRLHSIIDADKIMVLDAGKLVEFGSPWELLQNEKGVLRALVDESGDKKALYALAAGEVSKVEGHS